MQILTGERAHGQLRALVAANSVIGIAPYPALAHGGQAGPWQLLALAGAHGAIVCDVGSAPQLLDALAVPKAYATCDAKACARSLLAQNAQVPRRFAAIELNHKLLGSEAPREAMAAAVARACGLAPPPLQAHSTAQLVLQANFYREAALLQAQQLRADGLAQTSRLEAAVVAPLAQLEHVGMPFDVARWRLAVRHEAGQMRAWVRELAQALAVPPAALEGAPQALAAALRTAGHPVQGADAQALRRGLVAGPLGSAGAKLVAPLLRQQAMVRLARSHGHSFLRHVDPSDGRIHATFVQLGALTGRMACQAPNLQAVPKKEGRRACFAPDPTKRLVLADYAACELRILADASQDPAYLAAFARGDDVHAHVARAVFKTHVDRTTRPELREAAKTLSFGLVYGMQVEGLATLLGCGQAEAESLFARFFATYPQVQAFLSASEADALARGYATTRSGRRLRLPVPGTGPHAAGERGHIRRMARNMPIQGEGADLIKRALVITARRLAVRCPGAQLVHCVHDALVVECSAEASAQVAQEVATAMRDAGKGLLRRVTAEVDVAVASHWQ